MSDITNAREELMTIARELHAGGQAKIADRLRDIVNERMYRRPPARRATAHSNPITPEIIEQVHELARTTDLHSSEIAAQLNINPGRVSEILQGDR